MTLIVTTFLSFTATTWRAQIVGIAIFHETYSQEISYGNFTDADFFFLSLTCDLI